MKDELVKALALDGHVRIYIDRTTHMVQEAKERFDMNPTATAALGRTLSIASMMGSMLKSDQEMLTININGHGPIGSIVVDAYANGNVRGFVSDPQVKDAFKNGKLDAGAVVGKDGYLSVTKDLNMEQNFKGTVELQSGEIGDDFAYYFTVSEQTPTAVSVGVLIGTDGNVLSAGGLIIQMMPDASDTDISICEHVLEGLKPMSTIIQEYDDVELSQLAKDLFEDVKIVETREIRFSCSCSKERSQEILMTLPKEDIQKMIDEDGGCEITCNFCNEKYQFSKEELEAILERMNA
ncbi:Hsp33 family molecular chaperone HslO [Dubosiella newyorkensis]|uniref:Hsp33 family molecular chaperone HslO n=1 Tax=Dubosiella newyorkensis TaxID=1862672 RepID=UPI00272A5B27|nr:Hsp33 family molecular chaperone HslO [Dubosiella newyorkensis]